MTPLLTTLLVAMPVVVLLALLVTLRHVVKSDGRGHTLPPRSHHGEEIQQLRARGRTW